MPNPGVFIKVDGLKELGRSLNKLGRSLRGKIVRKALKESGKPILAAAKANVPVDTGLLKKQLKIKMMKAKGGRLGVKVGTQAKIKKNKETGERTKENAAQHAWIVEHGTAPRFTEDGKSTGTMPAQPFLRPAFDANKDLAVSIFKDTIKAGIDAEVGK